MTVAEYTLLHGYVPVAHAGDHLAIGCLIDGIRTAAAGAASDKAPPVSAIRLTVERARTTDAHVGFFQCVNKGRVVHALRAFEARQDHRKKMFRVLTESERRALAYIKIDVVIEMNRAGEEFAHRYHHASAASLGAGRNRLVDCLRAERRAIAFRTVARDVEIFICKNGGFDACEDFILL